MEHTNYGCNHGERALLPGMWPGFSSQTWHHTCKWVEFVDSLLCSKRPFSRYSGFPFPQKATFNLIWLWLPLWLLLIIILFIQITSQNSEVRKREVKFLLIKMYLSRGNKNCFESSKGRKESRALKIGIVQNSYSTWSTFISYN